MVVKIIVIVIDWNVTKRQMQSANRAAEPEHVKPSIGCLGW